MVKKAMTGLAPASLERESWLGICKRCRRSLALLGDIRRRSGSLLNSGKGLNPLGVSKTPFTSPRVHATFVVSHNVCDLTPVS
jgi:hypothetical protein